MRPWGCGYVIVRESCKPCGDGWPGLGSPPRGHYLLHVFEWLPVVEELSLFSQINLR